MLMEYLVLKLAWSLCIAKLATFASECIIKFNLDETGHLPYVRGCPCTLIVLASHDG